MVLAVAGGSDLLRRTQQVFFHKKPTKVSKVMKKLLTLLKPNTILHHVCNHKVGNKMLKACGYINFHSESVSMVVHVLLLSQLCVIRTYCHACNP